MKSLLLVLLVTFISTHIPSKDTFEVKGNVYHFNDNRPISGVKISVKGTTLETYTDAKGSYQLSIQNNKSILTATASGFEKQEIPVAGRLRLDFYLKPVIPSTVSENEVEIDLAIEDRVNSKGRSKYLPAEARKAQSYHGSPYTLLSDAYFPHNTEEYAFIEENIFHEPTRKPLSTFSIDVDAASYSNVRRFLQQGQRPPKDAVRIEEMVNYFNYDYPKPEGEHPFSVYTELSQAPWNSDHQLLHIGLQGRKIATDNLPPSNLVFLIDVSGSMNSPNKLGLFEISF